MYIYRAPKQKVAAFFLTLQLSELDGLDDITRKMKKAKAAAAAAAAATMDSSSSSIDSSNYPNCPSPSSSASSSSSSLCPTHNICSSISLGVGGCGCHFHDHQSTTKKDLSTDLKLGLSISPPCNRQSSASTTPRELKLNWPPIKPLLRSTLEAGKVESSRREQRDSFFVKVYMEGIPIGRKLDLFAHDGYNSLIKALGSMFHTTILGPKAENVHPNKDYILTYEDKEGDWMMVGDVPWEMFLNTVKRLKITRANGC